VKKVAVDAGTGDGVCCTECGEWGEYGQTFCDRCGESLGGEMDEYFSWQYGSS